MIESHPYLVTFLVGIFLMPIGYYSGRSEGILSRFALFLGAETVFLLFALFFTAPGAMFIAMTFLVLTLALLGLVAFMNGNRAYLRAHGVKV